MINTDALCRALERANAEKRKPWTFDLGGKPMVDWAMYAHRVAVLYAEETPVRAVPRDA